MPIRSQAGQGLTDLFWVWPGCTTPALRLSRKARFNGELAAEVPACGALSLFIAHMVSS